MIVNKITYWDKFLKYSKKVPKNLREKAWLKVELLLNNPFNPSLRLHALRWQLQWFWSISIDMKHRILFEIPCEWIIRLISIWKHSIYEKK